MGYLPVKVSANNFFWRLDINSFTGLVRYAVGRLYAERPYAGMDVIMTFLPDQGEIDTSFP